MTLIRGLHNLRAQDRGCVLTIGNFDGVHLGHQALIKRTVSLAQALGARAAVLSFEPTAREYFAPERAPRRIGTLRSKLCDLQALGVDQLIVQRFDQDFAQCSAQDFIDRHLCARLDIRGLVVGDDFRFGAQRRGDFALLQQAARARGFVLEGLGSVCLDAARASSTLVRDALAQPDLARAAQLLGRPYRMVGRVRGGLKLGRTLNMPTANVMLTRAPALRLGVYVTRLRRLDGTDARALPAVSNLGVRPTLGMTRCLLETHVLNQSLDLYGAPVAVEFVQFLRAEARFDSLDALAAQMQRDKAAALAFFARQNA
ncbi:bifunctional riboflavin kinase/FAD synthetase [Sinimarinibacterium sp. NLF-5-8]|uniref:bifunctional riboflavin kinase/FAD synthetase n=1 Tax=Sinimarinibacterium sp. NLF-5-8 TaxID=2698684 RepID=UPI00137C2337|nr:bifunctional riboflavin kinase/FAD synthetase [Sinimarinibacterium sp. NLF-5-8]QHS09912.1 bifunctional riboflavin kinase/FAD synthetase [Sinimarinibacterium sp. NLF-5-8]